MYHLHILFHWYTFTGLQVPHLEWYCQHKGKCVYKLQSWKCCSETCLTARLYNDSFFGIHQDSNRWQAIKLWRFIPRYIKSFFWSFSDLMISRNQRMWNQTFTENSLTYLKPDFCLLFSLLKFWWKPHWELMAQNDLEHSIE